MNGITKDSQKMICYIYKMYLERRKSGKSKAESRRFNVEFYQSDKALVSWHHSDIADCLMELGRNGYIHMYLGGEFELTDTTIVYMENRFQDGINQVLDWISKFIP